jgi:TRAP-type uncharacterized transport system substrate-binding protein
MLRNMVQTVKYTLISIKEMVVSAGPLALLALSMIALAFWWLNPNPPKQVTLATGPAQSAYEAFGERYARRLRASGVEVKLLPTEGSAENLELLRSGKADLGFVQGGTLDQAKADDYSLESLGSLFLEPVWLFYREDAAKRANRSAKPGGKSTSTPSTAPSATTATRADTLDHLSQLQGLKLNVGDKGSGVPTLMARLLDVNRVDAAQITLSKHEQTPAVMALLSGEIDALVMATAPEDLMVQMLLQTPGIRLMDFQQSEAYSRRFEFLSPVVLPQGVVDLAGDVPPQNLRLVASTTTLLAQEDTHPAILQLFSTAAKSLHGGAGWFSRAREFPKVTVGDFPMAPEAERYINTGATFLHRHAPFWLANLVERMWLAMGLILAVLIPLTKVVPPLYQFRIRSRVFKWYATLRDIEQRLVTSSTGAAVDKPALLQELASLEKVVGNITVPLSYTEEQYALLANIGLVRKKIVRDAT